MENYEFFKREFEFRGKHARMAEELWILNDRPVCISSSGRISYEQKSRTGSVAIYTKEYFP